MVAEEDGCNTPFTFSTTFNEAWFSLEDSQIEVYSEDLAANGEFTVTVFVYDSLGAE